VTLNYSLKSSFDHTKKLGQTCLSGGFLRQTHSSWGTNWCSGKHFWLARCELKPHQQLMKFPWARNLSNIA